MDSLRRRLLLLVERTTLAIGLVGLGWWSAFHIHAAAATQLDLDRFARLQTASVPARGPDQSLWSPQRVSAWRAALVDAAPAPIAVLRIPKIGLEVPVVRGTGGRALDRAVGHIEETAAPGADGNAGFAGHRDGFFRGLQRVAIGDRIELETLDGPQVYRVERTWVVDPDDITVLDPTREQALTLVTCYPFYFAGPAPQRFIVRAVRDEGTGAAAR